MNIQKVEQAVADILNVTAEEMHSRTRKREVVWARQIIIYYCLTIQSWNTQAGAYFQKHRTTVHYISKKVPEMIQFDKEFAGLWEATLTRLGHQSDSEKMELEDFCCNVGYR